MSMKKYFECTIKVEKTQEDGTAKIVRETYLVDALTFTESEARIIEELQNYISGEFEVTGIKPTNYADIFRSDYECADRFFKCKLFSVTLDEKSGAEKRKPFLLLVQASDLREAVKRIDEGMKGIMIDYEIASVALSPILEVVDYAPKSE